MKKQNMLKSSTTFSISLLISLTTLLASAPESSPLLPIPEEVETHKLAARDAIALSIGEVKGTRKFVNSFPQLKSLPLSQQDPKLRLCMEHLIVGLTDVKSMLYEVKQLESMLLFMDTSSVRRMMGRIVKLGEKCSGESLKNANETALLLLTRKLGDLSMVIDDEVYHVLEIQKSDFSGDSVEKP